MCSYLLFRPDHLHGCTQPLGNSVRRRPEYAAEMHGQQIAEEFPVVGLDTDAREAAELLASQRLPGLIVVDGNGAPYTILPASQVVRFLVPSYVQDDPSLARVIDESLA